MQRGLSLFILPFHFALNGCPVLMPVPRPGSWQRDWTLQGSWSLSQWQLFSRCVLVGVWVDKQQRVGRRQIRQTSWTTTNLLSNTVLWLVNKESKPTLGKCPGPPASGYLPCAQEFRADPLWVHHVGWGLGGGEGKEKTPCQWTSGRGKSLQELVKTLQGWKLVSQNCEEGL